jgi:octanoyl-[GcvH]:protein N-octanoyltransferase
LRLWRPLAPAISVGRLDLRDRRASEVLELAGAAGVPAVKRLAGGRAATLDAGCLCLGWAQPNPRMQESGQRYELFAEAILEALTELGVGASLSEALGEWCPGAWSVQGSSGKLAGLAQRVISGGAWCEALIVVDRHPELTALARQVHAALDLPWTDGAQGELSALVPAEPDLPARLSDVLVAALQRRWSSLERAPLPASVLGGAGELASEHRWG